MKTPVEEIYNKYEEFRNCKTKDEHADRFLAWFLCYKDNNLEKEKQAIIEAANHSSIKNKKLLESKDIIVSDKIGEQYYNQKYNK